MSSGTRTDYATVPGLSREAREKLGDRGVVDVFGHPNRLEVLRPPDRLVLPGYIAGVFYLHFGLEADLGTDACQRRDEAGEIGKRHLRTAQQLDQGGRAAERRRAERRDFLIE